MIVTVEALTDASRRALEKAGASPGNASEVANHLVLANLSGVDTHGVVHIPRYIDEIRMGWIDPLAEPAVLHEGSSYALVSGNWTFGQVATRLATEIAITKSNETGMAIVGLVQANHIGRVGHYVEMAAERRTATLVFSGGYGVEQPAAVPFGGRTALLHTNPIAFGFPGGSEPPLTFDFATTAVAGMKVVAARERSEQLPPNSIVDRDGRPTTNPADYFAGGSYLPFGGHKGYALMMASEFVGRIFTGSDRFADTKRGGPSMRHQGVTVIAFRVDLMDNLEDVLGRVDEMERRTHAVPPAPGFTEVMVPGDPERRAREQRKRDGIPIGESLWHELSGLAE
jgi:LDH2 family malate/lactate/ureidoglycolate dehydrogenase